MNGFSLIYSYNNYAKLVDILQPKTNVREKKKEYVQMKGLKTNEPTRTTTISFICMTITKYYSIAKAT